MNQERVIQQLQAAVSLHNQGEFDQAEAVIGKCSLWMRITLCA